MTWLIVILIFGLFIIVLLMVRPQPIRPYLPTLPKIEAPEIKIAMPPIKIGMPKIGFPAIRFPEIKFPEIKLPEYPDITKLFELLTENIPNTEDIKEDIIDPITNTIEGFSEDIEKRLEGLGQFGGQVLDTVKDIADKGKDVVDDVIQGGKDVVDDVIEGTKDIVKDVTDTAYKFTPVGQLEQFGKIWDETWSGIYQAVTNWWTGVCEMFPKGWYIGG